MRHLLTLKEEKKANEFIFYGPNESYFFARSHMKNFGVGKDINLGFLLMSKVIKREIHQ